MGSWASITVAHGPEGRRSDRGESAAGPDGDMKVCSVGAAVELGGDGSGATLADAPPARDGRAGRMGRLRARGGLLVSSSASRAMSLSFASWRSFLHVRISPSTVLISADNCSAVSGGSLPGAFRKSNSTLVRTRPRSSIVARSSLSRVASAMRAMSTLVEGPDAADRRPPSDAEPGPPRPPDRDRVTRGELISAQTAQTPSAKGSTSVDGRSVPYTLP